MVEDFFDIPTVGLPNFLSITLTPSNQIIHPGRVYGVFKHWDGKKPFSSLPKLYEDMDEFSANCIQLLDDEIQAIKVEILNNSQASIIEKNPSLDLSHVIPIKERIIKQYGEAIKDKRSLASVFSKNLGYSRLGFPVKEVEGGYILNFESRFFWEDIPYGLVILKDIATMLKVKTPWIDRIVEFHQKFMGTDFIKDSKLVEASLGLTGAPSRFGIKSIDQLMNLHCMRASL